MKKLSTLLIICLTFCTSCRERITYGTSMSIKNELIDTLSVTFYPKVKPFEYWTDYLLNANSKEGFYWTSEIGVNITDLITSVYDSILIAEKNGRFIIKFNHESAVNCNINPFNDSNIWGSEIIKGDEPTSFKRNPTETENFFFKITEGNLIK